MKLVFLLPLVVLGGCAAFDDGLYDVSDALKGDLRALGTKSQTTLATICKDLQSNQVSGVKKWSRTMVSIPAIVTQVSHSGSSYAVAFRDIKGGKHSAVAYTRSANAANEEKISAMSAGDKIYVLGTLSPQGSSLTGKICSFRFDKARFKETKR